MAHPMGDAVVCAGLVARHPVPRRTVDVAPWGASPPPHMVAGCACWSGAVAVARAGWAGGTLTGRLQRAAIPGGTAPPSVQVGANARRAAAATASFTLPYQPRLFPYPLGCARVTPPHAQEWHRRPWPLRAAALPSSRLVHLGETLLAAGKRLACAIVFAPRWDGTPRVALLRGSLPPLRPPPSVYFGSHLYGMALKR